MGPTWYRPEFLSVSRFSGVWSPLCFSQEQQASADTLLLGTQGSTEGPGSGLGRASSLRQRSPVTAVGRDRLSSVLRELTLPGAEEEIRQATIIDLF